MAVKAAQETHLSRAIRPAAVRLGKQPPGASPPVSGIIEHSPAFAVSKPAVWREQLRRGYLSGMAGPVVEWQPVSEIPPRAEPYLVTRQLERRRFVVTATWSGEEWWADGHTGEVVAWAELPEPWGGRGSFT